VKIINCLFPIGLSSFGIHTRHLILTYTEAKRSSVRMKCPWRWLGRISSPILPENILKKSGILRTRSLVTAQYKARNYYYRWSIGHRSVSGQPCRASVTTLPRQASADHDRNPHAIFCKQPGHFFLALPICHFNVPWLAKISLLFLEMVFFPLYIDTNHNEVRGDAHFM
jgi:hypothetical protein